MKKKKWIVLISSLISVYLIGFLGSLFVRVNKENFWNIIWKPTITPPDFVFSIVWNVLFLLIALSFYFTFTNLNKKQKSKKRNLILIFAINLIFNLLWSIFFFGIKNPVWAYFDLVLLWFSIGIIFIETWKIKKLSSWLILPYWLWVSFAGILNWLIAFGMK